MKGKVGGIMASMALILLWVIACRVQGNPPPTGSLEGEPGAARQAKAHYLANAGVLIASGETKVVFDPLFRNDFGTYQLLPEELEHALFAGEPPLDGIDAVLISHYHEDHFSPADMLRLLEEQKGIQLYAPVQAVSGMRDVAREHHRGIFDRVNEIALEYQDAPLTIEAGEMIIEAVRIPHTGWPERLSDVQNIAYRVTLDEETTVLHLGDADTKDVHFAHDAEHWDRRHTDMAFPPYWYFQSEDGRQVLDNRLKPGHAVGVHVPVTMSGNPDERPSDLRGYDLFLTPGETRDIPR
ncbi:MAG TPA: MBL fold metallo-hydrolase [Vicinamibacteria bacterium]|nr:MBL fold metallo-hydrolase [Vicinamibacteria bacterium]